MPDHLKSLVVIMVLTTLTFAFANRPAVAMAITAGDFTRRRNLWFALTAIAFLAHNFWLYVIAAGALLLTAAKRDTNKMGLYFFLLFALPPISAEISGLGIIKHFFAIDYLRLLSLTILLPAALLLRKQAVAEQAKPGSADKLLAAYLILNLLLQLRADSFTNTLRQGFYSFVDVVLPYYVASRSLRDLQGFRDALMGFAVAGMVLATIAVFESGMHWLLYAPLKDALGAPWGFGNYLERDSTLRALASTGQPIVLGYVMAVAFGIFLFVRRSVPDRSLWLAGLALLLAGLIVPVSRGPWIGAAALLLVFIASGPRAVARISKLALLGVVAVPTLLSLPGGEKLINYLPFVGTVETGSITYRQRLIDAAIDIVAANPLFGSYDFLLYMEELRQGEGIIDLVNSYLSIALSSGLLGLALFVAFFGVVLIGIFKAMRGVDENDELRLLGRVLIATTSGILVAIFTVSSINVIPVVYWSIAGLGLAYSRLAAESTAASAGLSRDD